MVTKLRCVIQVSPENTAKDVDEMIATATPVRAKTSRVKTAGSSHRALRAGFVTAALSTPVPDSPVSPYQRHSAHSGE